MIDAKSEKRSKKASNIAASGRHFPMEHIGAKYEPLDYIRDLEFYTKHFFAASDTGKGPTYYIIDETETHGFAFAPSGAEKGKKYCIYEQVKGA